MISLNVGYFPEHAGAAAGLLGTGNMPSPTMSNRPIGIRDALSLLLITQSAAASTEAVCWSTSIGGNGHWYQIVLIEDGTNWSSCKHHAEALGGHLATITNSSENDFLSTLVGESGPWFSRYGNQTLFDGPWIGGFRAGINDEWQWVTGESWEFSAWCSNQPSTVFCDGGETTLSLKRDGYCSASMNWGDINSSGYCPPYITTMGSFLVEWSADCNADGIVDYGQILAGDLSDTNSNGIPDLCELPTCIDADLNPNGIVDGADLGALLAFWGSVSPAFPRADINGDGNVNGADLGILLSVWGPCGG